MFVYEIKPNGLCGGVKRAIKMITNALNDPNTKRPIYMLGNLIHNKLVVNSLVNSGVILVTTDYLEFLDTISYGTIVFTAHGISPVIFNKAKEKGLDIIDTTCVHVLKIQETINEKINNNQDVIVVGNKKHPEVLSYLGISPSVYVYNKDMDVKGNSFVINQTTLVYDDVIDVFNDLKQKNENIEISEEICDATKRRQNALKDELDNYDMFLIVGDKLSNNCRSLLEIVLKNGKIGYQVENVNELNNISFKGINSIGVTSGASTPPLVTKEIIDELNEYKEGYIFKSNLKENDYVII